MAVPLILKQLRRRSFLKFLQTICMIVLALLFLKITLLCITAHNITNKKDQEPDSQTYTTTLLQRRKATSFKTFQTIPAIETLHGDYVSLEHLLQADHSFGYKESITLTTQATPDLLGNLVEQSRRWNGPISVAVYAPCNDFRDALIYALQLRKCNVNIANLVTFHFVYPAPDTMIKVPDHHNRTLLKSGNTPYALIRNCAYHDLVERLPFNYIRVHKEVLSKYNKDDMSLFSCSSPNLNPPTKPSFRRTHLLPYPINVCRNIARLAAQTHYVMAADIELYPSAGVIQKFLNFRDHINLRVSNPNSDNGSLHPNQVFVLPVFELHHSVQDVPTLKQELVDLYHQKKAQSLLKHKCTMCLTIPKMDEWMAAPLFDSQLNVFMTVKRHQVWYHWEPFFIGTNDDPLYNELQTWEGENDKMIQMYEVCLRDYNLSILDNAFLVHRPGIKRRSSASKFKRDMIFYEQNSNAYWLEINKLDRIHGRNPLCRQYPKSKT